MEQISNSIHRYFLPFVKASVFNLGAAETDRHRVGGLTIQFMRRDPALRQQALHPSAPVLSYITRIE